MLQLGQQFWNIYSMENHNHACLQIYDLIGPPCCCQNRHMKKKIEKRNKNKLKLEKKNNGLRLKFVNIKTKNKKKLTEPKL